jgi:hypothetical protein
LLKVALNTTVITIPSSLQNISCLKPPTSSRWPHTKNVHINSHQ